MGNPSISLLYPTISLLYSIFFSVNSLFSPVIGLVSSPHLSAVRWPEGVRTPRPCLMIRGGYNHNLWVITLGWIIPSHISNKKENGSVQKKQASRLYIYMRYYIHSACGLTQIVHPPRSGMVKSVFFHPKEYIRQNPTTNNSDEFLFLSSFSETKSKIKGKQLCCTNPWASFFHYLGAKRR